MRPETVFDRFRRLQRRLRRRRIIFKVPIRRLVDRENPMERYNAIQFKNRFHMNKETTAYIMGLISPNLVSPMKRGCQLPPVLQLLTVVRFYCTGSFQIVIGDCLTQSINSLSTCQTSFENVCKVPAELHKIS